MRRDQKKVEKGRKEGKERRIGDQRRRDEGEKGGERGKDRGSKKKRQRGEM
jgi:hypothetical protein